MLTKRAECPVCEGLVKLIDGEVKCLMCGRRYYQFVTTYDGFYDERLPVVTDDKPRCSICEKILTSPKNKTGMCLDCWNHMRVNPHNSPRLCPRCKTNEIKYRGSKHCASCAAKIRYGAGTEVLNVER